MNIAVVGTGYVGLVSAVCFADLGHTVYGVDIDQAKVDLLKQGKSPIYEPGLEELLERNLAGGRLQFTTDLTEVLNECAVVFCAVATPPKEDYSADLRAVEAVSKQVAQHAEHNTIFVNKSTVPVGTGAICQTTINNILQERGVDYKITVISNPEFLREGSAVYDTLNPDRIVVGINGDATVKETIDELYAPLAHTGKPLLHMTRESAELVKYASNTFLATKISFVNMLSEFCEVTGANIKEVAQGMGLDERIGSRFLQSGIGFGGSCFPKDVKALMAMSKEFAVPLSIVDAVHHINTHQRERFIAKITTAIAPGATVAIWGLSFKPNTDDMRDAPSVDVINALLKHGVHVKVYDPVAMQKAKELWLPEGIEYTKGPIDCASNADAVVLLTEWDEFRGVDLTKVKQVMQGNALFDGRNVFEPKHAASLGFTYTGIGIPGQDTSSKIQVPKE